MLIPLAILLMGFLLLYFGGDCLVRGSSSLALQLGLTPLVVGLTVVAFGTSSPELAVSLQAALGGSDDVALGNVVGSNICNLGLILAVAALVRPITIKAQVLRIDLPIMIAVSALLPIFLWNGLLSRFEGGLLLLFLVAYVVMSLRLARREKAAVQAEFAGAIENGRPLWHNLALIGGGLAFLVCGGSLFVNGAVQIARTFGISEAVIGLTVVALGTSMPELAASAIAAFKGEGDIAIGNVVGSTIFNILCILGLTATITPLHSRGITAVDLWVMVGMAAIVLPLMYWDRRLGRFEAAILLAAYASYLAYLLS